jgi:hypothetical protein
VPSHYKEAYQQVELVRKTELVEDTVGWWESLQSAVGSEAGRGMVDSPEAEGR